MIYGEKWLALTYRLCIAMSSASETEVAAWEGAAEAPLTDAKEGNEALKCLYSSSLGFCEFVLV